MLRILYLTIISFLFSLSAQAQTVSFSPTSVPLWGQLPNTMKASVEYKDFELIAVHPMQTLYDNLENGELTAQSSEYSGYYFGLFYTPIEVEYMAFTVDAGAGIWSRKFPTVNGQRIHFTLQVDYRISELFSVSYSHISNGFGIANSLNPGLDSVGLKVHL